jgi:hypothetical protein
MVIIATLWDILRNHSNCCRHNGDDDHNGDIQNGGLLDNELNDANGGSYAIDPDLLHEHNSKGGSELFQYADPHATMVYDAQGTIGSSSSPSSSLRRMSPMGAAVTSGSGHHGGSGHYGRDHHGGSHRDVHAVAQRSRSGHLPNVVLTPTKRFPLYIRVLQSFSLPRNVNHLLAPIPATPVGPGNNSAIELSSLNGIRVVSMAWLIRMSLLSYFCSGAELNNHVQFSLSQ